MLPALAALRRPVGLGVDYGRNITVRAGKSLEDGLPRRFAASNVEHGPDGPSEQKFRDGHREAHLALESVFCGDAGDGIAIELIEVGLVVSFHMRRLMGTSSAVPFCERPPGGTNA